MKYTFAFLAALVSVYGASASPIESDSTFPPTPSKVTVWPKHNEAHNSHGPAKSVKAAQGSWSVAIQIENPRWGDVHGHYLQVEGDQNLGINWLTLGPTWRDRGQSFQWVPRDQTGSGVGVVGNIQHPALWAAVPVWAGFLKNELDSGVSPLPVFMSAEGGPQQMYWFEDLALTREGYLVRLINGAGIEQGYSSWIMCWTTYPVDQSQFLGLHWSTDGQYDRSKCGRVHLRITF